MYLKALTPLTRDSIDNSLVNQKSEAILSCINRIFFLKLSILVKLFNPQKVLRFEFLK